MENLSINGIIGALKVEALTIYLLEILTREKKGISSEVFFSQEFTGTSEFFSTLLSFIGRIKSFVMRS